jgi:hypothetical protein
MGFLNASEVSVRFTDTAAPDALPAGSRHIMNERATNIAEAFLFRVAERRLDFRVTPGHVAMPDDITITPIFSASRSSMASLLDSLTFISGCVINIKEPLRRYPKKITTRCVFCSNFWNI